MNNREKIDFITNWIMDYASNMQNPAKTLVVGVSGGIDSALTSSLCALTGIQTIAVRMPIINSCEIGSIKHCDWLKKSFNNVEVHEIDLTNIFEKFSNITKKIKFESDVVLISVGRKPYTKNLNLEKVGIQLDEKKRIKVSIIRFC